MLYTAICAQRTMCIAFRAIPIEDNNGYKHFIHTKMESSLTCVYAASQNRCVVHGNMCAKDNVHCFPSNPNRRQQWIQAFHTHEDGI